MTSPTQRMKNADAVVNLSNGHRHPSVEPSYSPECESLESLVVIHARKKTLYK